MDSATRRRLESQYRFEEWAAPRRSAHRYFIWRMPPDGLRLSGWNLQRNRSLALADDLRWTERILSRRGQILKVDTYECSGASSAWSALLGMLAQAEYVMDPWSNRAAGDVAFGAFQSRLAIFCRGNLLVQVTGLDAPAQTVRAAAQKLDDLITEPPREPALHRAEADAAPPAYDLIVRGRRIHVAADDEEIWFKFVMRNGDAISDAGGIRWIPDRRATSELTVHVLKGGDVVGAQRHETTGDESI